MPGGTENIAYLTLFFEGSQIAHIHAELAGARQSAAHTDRCEPEDDCVRRSRPGEKIKIYDKGITLNNQQNRRSCTR